MRIIVGITLLYMLLVLLTGCGKDAYIGKWEQTSARLMGNGILGNEKNKLISITKEGTKYLLTTAGRTYSGKKEGQLLVFTDASQGARIEFKCKGDLLTADIQLSKQEPNGSKVTFHNGADYQRMK